MESDRPKKYYIQQLSLTLKLISDSLRGVTKHQLMRLVDLDNENPSDEKQFHRIIERLQSLGYPITYNPDAARYLLDGDRIFTIETSDADLTLLKTAIRQAPYRSVQTALVLENALAKLHATGTSRKHGLNLSVEIPDEDLLLYVISSIERKKRVRFSYTAAQSGQPAWRIFDPYLVFSRAHVFYVCGRACADTHTMANADTDYLRHDNIFNNEWEAHYDGDDVNVDDADLFFLSEDDLFFHDRTEGSQKEQWKWRTYRISRIDEDTYEEIGDRSRRYDAADARKKVRNFFDVDDVVIAIRSGKARALRSIAEKIDHSRSQCPEGWDYYRIDHIDRRFLFERLMTYGSDVQLISPRAVRDDWYGRLTHLSTIGANK